MNDILVCLILMQIWSHHKRVCEAQGTKQLISSHEKGLSLLKIAIIVSFISLLLSPCMEIVHPSGLGHFWTQFRVFEFRVGGQIPIWALQAPFSHAHKRGGGVVLEIFCTLLCELCDFGCCLFCETEWVWNYRTREVGLEEGIPTLGGIIQCDV